MRHEKVKWLVFLHRTGMQSGPRQSGLSPEMLMKAAWNVWVLFRKQIICRPIWKCFVFMLPFYLYTELQWPFPNPFTVTLMYLFYFPIKTSLMKWIRNLFTSKAIDQFKQHLHICTGKVNQTQLKIPKVTGKLLGRSLWKQERRSGLSCLKNVINLAVHSQAPEINMYSTTLISPYYALNYGP